MSPIRMSKLESGIRVVLEFNEAFNRHDVAGMMQLMSDDCIFENSDPAPDGAVYSGKEVVTQFWQDFFRESPHAHIEIEEIFPQSKASVSDQVSPPSVDFQTPESGPPLLSSQKLR